MPRINYFSSANGTVGARLDKAWVDYQNEQLQEEERKRALEFMIYIFDLDLESLEKNDLNRKLVFLIGERQAHQAMGNEEYIPILNSGPYNFQQNAQTLLSTDKLPINTKTKVDKEIKAGRLLDVNAEDKEEDKKSLRRNSLNYLSLEERADYRIEIHKGKFYKNGGVFDGSSSRAHSKPGYVAFTLNTNGELSAFEHFYGKRLTPESHALVHASMNAGAPVLIAGEMEIKNGKLISLNTYSGHYQPSLYSVALFLRYLNSRGVDISESSVLLQKKPSWGSGLKSRAVKVEGDDYPWNKVSATDVVATVDSVMKRNISSINNYLNSFETKFYSQVFKSESTLQKIQLAKIFQREMQAILMEMKEPTSSKEKIKFSVDRLEKKIEDYIKANEKIAPNSGRLGKKLEAMKEQMKEIKASTEENYRDKRDDSFRKQF